MDIAPEFLSLLRCPVSGQKMRQAPELATSFGWESALITEDGKLAYPVRDGIPVLLPEEGKKLDAPPSDVFFP